MDSFMIDYITENSQVLYDKWLDEISDERYSYAITKTNISDEIYKNTNREFIETIIRNIEKDQEEVSNDLELFTERLMKLGWPLHYITQGLQVFRRVVLESIFENETVKSGNPLEMVNEVDRWVESIINQMVTYYSGSWENTVSLQKVALEELSSPLIPLMEGITVMPLIGTIDTERAKLIMENLLEGVGEHRSEVVLIDITGVPVVDTMVAHHIIQAVEAVRLIGSKAILVGIRPEIAQTIVNLGIDLSDFPTKSSMKKGIEAALKITNRMIVDA